MPLTITQNPAGTPGNIESGVPRPSSTSLTDVKVKRMCSVLVPFLSLSLPIFAGILIGTTQTISAGVLFGLTAGAISAFCVSTSGKVYQKVDFQTEEGAKEVREDLRSKTLSELGNKYSLLTDLEHYGFISKEIREKMEELLLNKESRSNAEIEEAFNKLRSE